MKQIRLVFLLLIIVGINALTAQSLTLSGPATGDQDCMLIGDLTGQISTTYTVEAWIYPTELTGVGTDQSTYGYTVMASSFAAANGYPLWLTVRGSEVRVWTFESTATTYHETSGAGIALNTWAHIAVTTTKSGTTTVYVNGINKLTYVNDGETNWSSILTVGALRPTRATSNIPFIGLMDEVRVWNDVRTEQEIQDNMYNEINVSDIVAKQGLVGYWNFNDGIDPTEDLSDNNNTGDLIQGATFGAQAPTVDSPATLPVVLSSFTALTTVDNTVGLKWITQSEMNLSGYYIYRSTDNSISNAIIMSPLIQAENSSNEAVYNFVDNEVELATTYNFWLQSIDLSGYVEFFGPVTVTVSSEDSGQTPDTQNLDNVIKSVYPNPFNPSTTISYSLAGESNVKVSIYNTRGQLVRSFDEGRKGMGDGSVTWNGLDESGSTCSSGIYFIKLSVNDASYMRKAVMMK
jgi:hypothetical protein